jgi:hypothetical protein
MSATPDLGWILTYVPGAPPTDTDQVTIKTRGLKERMDGLRGGGQDEAIQALVHELSDIVDQLLDVMDVLNDMRTPA